MNPRNPRSTKVTTSAAVDIGIDLDYFWAFGFLVLRRFFDPRPLLAEFEQVMKDGLVSSSDLSHSDGIHFQYVPMMTAATPVSLSLLDRLADVAERLLGTSVLPTRAKAVRYSGDTPWHVDSVVALASIGFAAYLDPLAAGNGALRVLPGSHRRELGDAIRLLGGAGMHAMALPSHAVVTEPGHMIVFDEHLFHASSGGGVRRQWRMDYVSDPVDAGAENNTIEYFARIFPPDWDGGYDIDRYPSYGPDWRASGRPAVERLEALGVFELAARQEAFGRTKRKTPE